MKTDLIRRVVRINLGLAFVEGVFVFWQYIQTPSESSAAILFGFSALRLAILAGVLLALAVTGYLFISALRPAWWERRSGRLVTQIFEGRGIFWFLLPALVISYFIVFSTGPYLGFIAGYRERLFPILVWFAVIVFQFLCSWLHVRALELKLFERFRDVLLPAGIALLCIFLIVLLIAVTRIGIRPDAVYWQEAGVPILFAQVLIVAAVGALLSLFFRGFNIPDNRKVDTLIFIALWLFTFLVWAGTPAKPAYNMLEPSAPNFQGYPFGDAMLYDVTAQNFLIGKSIPADFWAKPLYSLFLSILHLMAGQDFALVSLLQVGFLACIPSFLYLLVEILGGRLAGIVAALLLTLREWNAIRLSNVIQVSHVKFLLSDVFAMGGIIVLTWLLLHWFEKPSPGRAVPIAAGGVMGLLIITRGHPVLIVPVLFVLAYIFLRKNVPQLRDGVLKVTFGLLLVMLPWFWHVYDLTGSFAFQDTHSSFARQDAFVQAYSETGGADSASYAQFEAQVVEQVLTQPMEVTRFVSSHYAHNAVFSYIFLPQSFSVESLRSYVKRLPFWGNWQGEMGLESWILIVIHTSILALGIGAAWKKSKGLLFVPLVIGAAYNLSVAVSRRSGWRFIQPADWVTLVFYAIGIVQMILIVSSIVKKSFDEQTERPVEEKQPLVAIPTMTSYVLVSLPFLSIMAAMLWGQHLFPPRYSSADVHELVQTYEGASSGSQFLGAAQVEEFLLQEDAVIVHGKALYPVYFKADVGALNYSWMSFAPKPYKRLVFYVIGAEPAGVILPLESPPSDFRDGAEVIVLGCRTETGDIDALGSVITSTNPEIVFHRDAPGPLVCPLPEPH